MELKILHTHNHIEVRKALLLYSENSRVVSGFEKQPFGSFQSERRKG